MELTKEYFDKGIAKVLDVVVTKEEFKSTISELERKMATKEDLKALERRVVSIDLKVGAIESVMVTKADLKEALNGQTAELKDYTHQAFEAQQIWMENRFDELIVKYDVRERVDKLEKEVSKLKLAH
jgi:hypothetical protein